MPFITTRPRVLALGAVCAAAGAGAGTVAAAGAAAPHHSASSAGTPAQRRGAARHGGIMRLARRTVHAQLVVYTPRGFRTVRIDRGTVDSVSARTLTMTDGTPKASDGKVTLVVPANARVRNDRHPATLASLRAGERVVVIQLPRRMVVRAHWAKG
jgi:hypothetical protein